MTTYHVGGLNPFNKCKTLKDAVEKAKYDDVIEIHRSIDESVTIKKPLTIKGNGNVWNVEPGTVGLQLESQVILDGLTFKVGSRANGLVIQDKVTMSNVTVAIDGPVTAFYPVLWVKAGHNHTMTNCTLTKVVVDEDATVTLNDSNVYSYYGKDIETDERNECSLFAGDTIVNGGHIASTTFYNVDMKNVAIGQYVRVQDASLNKVVLTEQIPEKVSKFQMTQRQRKKEPEHGPLSVLTNNNYHVYGTGNVQIDGYRVEQASEAIGFYFSGANVNVTNVHNTEQTIKHNAYKSSLSFKDVEDQNYWYVDDTTTQLVRSDINTNSVTKTAMEQLDELIGLGNVKQQLRSLLNSIKVGGNKGFSNHMIFAGEAGTGKTTVAKLVAQALFEVGAIPENKCTFATNDTLIEGYVGQTAKNVARVLDEALGGVLFIDEAYQLAVKKGENTFNDEAIAVLIRYMEDHRDDLVVIAAGYSKEMREFLASNTGLSRRFQWIEFDDYTPDEMAQIFELMRKQHDDQYASDVDPRIIRPLFAKLVELNLAHPDANGRVTNGGNGGLVRNVYQRITLAKNDRFVQDGGELTITKADIVKGFEAEMKQTLQKKGS